MITYSLNKTAVKSIFKGEERIHDIRINLFFKDFFFYLTFFIL